MHDDHAVDDHAVDGVLQRNLQADVPADVEARLRQQLRGFQARVDREHHPVREWAGQYLWRFPMRWAAAAVVLTAVAALVVVWDRSDGSRVYAATAQRFAAARSIRYTIELAPFVSVDFSHLAPASDRVSTSWGIEIRSDGSGAQLVLLHGSRQFVRETKSPGDVMHTADLIEQLSALPRTADAALGERTTSGKRLVGYRVLGSHMPGAHGVESLDLWIDARTEVVDHVDVTPKGAGASGYQIHIRSIQVDSALDPALFAMTAPPGYADAAAAATSGRPLAETARGSTSSPPTVAEVPALRAVVVSMSGPYQQASAAAAKVAQYLLQQGIAPVGPAFGRFESEAHWVVGYPAPAAAKAAAPFEVIDMPGGLAASMSVTGPWGLDSTSRWSTLLDWIAEHGYQTVGPPTESWSGNERFPDTQVTEMRIAIRQR
jgi:effector-binding domain-containing protein